MAIPSVYMYIHVSLYTRLDHLGGGGKGSLPTPPSWPESWRSVHQFLTRKRHGLMPHTPYSPNVSLSDFFFVSPSEKSPQRETFCPCGISETKNSRSSKSHQNQQVQKPF